MKSANKSRERLLAEFFQSLSALRKCVAQIEVVLMGVDGGVTLLSQTEEIALEIKTFDAHDGHGLTLAHTAGRQTICDPHYQRISSRGLLPNCLPIAEASISCISDCK